jgi:hypothetical protein
MKNKIVLSGDEWRTGEYHTIEWEQSVKILNWEHDFEKDTYTIIYEEKK